MITTTRHPGGRPTKYTPDMIELADKYLKTTGTYNMKLPTIEGLALYLGLHRDTLYEWAKKYPQISDTLRNIEQLQKEQLIESGIYGGKEVNATIVKLLLQNNHGMREKQDVTTDGEKLEAPHITLDIKS